jgi:hypothetical protein
MIPIHALPEDHCFFLYQWLNLVVVNYNIKTTFKYKLCCVLNFVMWKSLLRMKNVAYKCGYL